MIFNSPLLKAVRILLFPFSILYLIILRIRNSLFDRNLIPATSFNLPIICVGNLAVGGTGKSPMIEYLVRLLSRDVPIATLSRGYKRKTRGYALAGEQSNALEIGDEPMQFHRKFPGLTVAVGEQRVEAIPQLLHDRPDTKAILLDDAFQHRQVKAGLNILLTDYSNLYTRDWYLPAGELRDQRSSAARADLIVVTKCSASLSREEADRIREELKPLPHQQVFFSAIRYGKPYHIISKNNREITGDTEVLLVTGIANPLPLKKMLTQNAGAYYELSYSDHYIFTIDDLKSMVKRFKAITAENKMMLTTEKDAVRLMKFDGQLEELPFYVIPIEQSFLFGEGPAFDGLIQSFIHNFKYSLP